MRNQEPLANWVAQFEGLIDCRADLWIQGACLVVDFHSSGLLEGLDRRLVLDGPWMMRGPFGQVEPLAVADHFRPECGTILKGVTFSPALPRLSLYFHSGLKVVVWGRADRQPGWMFCQVD